jgi:hypothetical protein
MRISGVVLAVLAMVSCAGAPESDPRYRPPESLLEVVAVLRHHVPDDTYRFEPARDFTGRNIYRASLIRLENLEGAYEGEFRSGYMADVFAFSKARSLERLRAYDLAAENYRAAAEGDDRMRPEALRSAAVCEGLAEALSLDPLTGNADQSVGDREDVLSVFATRRALLEAMLADVSGSHHHAVVREEIEQVDVARARYLTDIRRTSGDGDVRAVAAWQEVSLDHRDSKNANRLLLELADLYADLAEGYVTQNPPESLHFDPPSFEELATSATRLYEAVANQDGATERIEAARRLEAFLAFTLRIDRDRFSR